MTLAFIVPLCSASPIGPKPRPAAAAPAVGRGGVAAAGQCGQATIVRGVFPQPGLAAALVNALPEMDVRDVQLRAGPEGQITVVGAWPAAVLPRSVVAALRELARRHVRATGASEVLGRVSVVRGTPCPRWHVDKVRLRGLLTLHGPGVEMLVEGRVQRAGTGDLVLMPGAGAGEADMEKAVWHRSPRYDDGVRVIVQTDCVE